jgi:hypothetical protein
MRGLQVGELSFNPQQKKDQGKNRAQKVLPKMPQAHAAQRIEISFDF